MFSMFSFGFPLFAVRYPLFLFGSSGSTFLRLYFVLLGSCSCLAVSYSVRISRIVYQFNEHLI